MTEQVRIAAIRRAVNYSHLRNEVTFNSSEVVSAEAISGGSQSRVRLMHDRSDYTDKMAVPSTSKRSLVPRRERVLTINRVPLSVLADDNDATLLVYAPTGEMTTQAVTNRIAQLGYPDYSFSFEVLAGDSAYKLTPNPNSIYFRGPGIEFTLDDSDNEFLNLPVPGLTYRDDMYAGLPSDQDVRFNGFDLVFRCIYLGLRPTIKSFIIDLTAELPMGWAALFIIKAPEHVGTYPGFSGNTGPVIFELINTAPATFAFSGTVFEVDENGVHLDNPGTPIVGNQSISNASKLSITISNAGTVLFSVVDDTEEPARSWTVEVPSLGGEIVMGAMVINTSETDMPVEYVLPIRTLVEAQQ